MTKPLGRMSDYELKKYCDSLGMDLDKPILKSIK